MRLIEDIRTRKDDYAGQLSSLILAAKSAFTDKNTESEQSIMNSLVPPKDLHEKSLAAAKEEKLWQARLILAIGEILDQEEEEIACNLAMLDDDQAELFKQLHGDNDETDEDSPFAELIQVERNLGAAKSGNVKNRFNAWKNIFLEGDMQEYHIFLTNSQDSGDLLLELYEKKTGLPAPLVASLELPGLIGRNSADASQSVVGFWAKNEELLAHFHKILSDLSRQKAVTTGDTAGSDAFAAISDQWRRQIEAVFPAKRYGRIPIKFFVFPGLSGAALIGKKQPAVAELENGLLVVTG